MCVLYCLEKEKPIIIALKEKQAQVKEMQDPVIEKKQKRKCLDIHNS